MVLAFGGYSGGAVEGNLLCLDPGGQLVLGPSCLPMTLPSLAAAALMTVFLKDASFDESYFHRDRTVLLCAATLKATELHAYDAQSPTSPQPRFAHTMAAVYNNHSNMVQTHLAGLVPSRTLLVTCAVDHYMVGI